MAKGKIIDINIGKKNLEEHQERIKLFKFGLHKQVMISEKGELIETWFIAIKDRKTNVTLELTPYTKLLRYSTKAIDSRQSETIRSRGVFLCMFLNYILIDNYERFQLDDIRNIDIEHGNSFLRAYSYGEIGGKEKTINTLETAIDKLTKVYVAIKAVYKKEAKFIYKKKFYEKDLRGKQRLIVHFKIEAKKNMVNNFDIFRDMPERVFWIFLDLSKIYYPELTFAIALQAFAGLRPGEVCNVQQAITPMGESIKYQRVGNKLLNFEINLKQKYKMRNDSVDVGGIKVKRKQKVYPKYLPVIDELYKRHLEILQKYELEDGCYPMFVGKDGKAITTKNYREKIQRLINKYLRDELLKSDDNLLRHYGEILTQKTLSPHFLRHFFTVRLVLDDLQVHSIAYWRGDRSLDTALHYCRNKEELRNAIYNSNSKMVETILRGVQID